MDLASQPSQPLDFTPFLDQVRRNTDLSNLMLQDARIVVCLGSRALLAAFLGWIENPDHVLGAATTEDEGLALVEQHQPTMVLLSDRLERGHGVALVQQIKARWPQIHTLLLITQEQRHRQIKAAIDACCDGLLVESRMGLGAGVAALQAVSGGGIYIDKSLQELFRRGHEGEPPRTLKPQGTGGAGPGCPGQGQHPNRGTPLRICRHGENPPQQCDAQVAGQRPHPCRRAGTALGTDRLA